MFLSKLEKDFFNRDSIEVAKDLLGKVMCVKYQDQWLYVQIIETEAYFIHEKASHASLGFTEKRKALFMPAGTIYMYYSRAGDSMNISCKGEGNAVLLKSGYPYKTAGFEHMIKTMQALNPKANGNERSLRELCSGQVLLCKSLNLKIKDWDQKQFDKQRFYIGDAGYHPKKIIQSRRLGIRAGRDEHLPYRFIDFDFAKYASSNPLSKRGWKPGVEYSILLREEE